MQGGEQGRLAGALQEEFSRQSRSKGAYYLNSGRVREVTVKDDTFLALVRGSGDDAYTVSLKIADEDDLEASCTCPYYAEHVGFCKHMWAAILEADRRAWPATGFVPRFLVYGDPEDEDERQFESFDDSNDVAAFVPPPHPVPPTTTKPKPPRTPPTPDWLTSLQRPPAVLRTGGDVGDRGERHRLCARGR